jgi:hypothetical protein
MPRFAARSKKPQIQVLIETARALAVLTDLSKMAAF